MSERTPIEKREPAWRTGMPCQWLLAVSPGRKVFKFSVKTRHGTGDKPFILTARDERDHSPDLFYAFVQLNLLQKEVDYWLIPSARVAEVISQSHQLWLRAPGRNNRSHVDSNVRKLPVKGEPYYPDDWPAEMATYYKSLIPIL